MRTVERERIDPEALLAAKQITLKREKGRKAFEQLIAAAPHSVAAHARLIHRDDTGQRITTARHHREWVRIMEDVENYRWVVIIAPPGYAKTTWFSHIYPSWVLGRTGGRKRIGIISRTATQASLIAQSIRETADNALFQSTYPDCVPDYDRGWTQTKFFFTNTPEGPNPAVGAFGVGSRQIQGRRFDEIIMDDPVNWEDVSSETIMQKLRHWQRTMLLQRFPPGMGPPDGGGRMVVVLTRWGEQDLVPELKELGFKIVRMPALGYWDRVVTDDLDEDGSPVIEYGVKPLWGKKESRESLEKARHDDEISFELVMQGNVKVLAGDTFSRSWFQRGVPPSIKEFDQIIQYVDTAGGKDRKKGDYFAMATVGSIRKGEEIWILDMVRHRKAAPEQERTVLTEYARWQEYGHQPDLLIIEDANEGRALYQRLVTTTRLPLKAYTPVKDKLFRSIPLSNAYRAGRVWHPANSDGDPEEWVGPFERELAAFPDGPHDDQVDAAGGAYNQMQSDAGLKLRSLG